MEKLNELIDSALERDDLNFIVLSHPYNKKNNPQKASIRPIVIKQKKMFQVSEQRGTQVFHANKNASEVKKYIEDALKSVYREAHFFVGQEDRQVWIKKDGGISMNTSATIPIVKSSSHNRTKKYLLEEGVPYPFFVALKIMDSKGRVFPERRNKFIQVNHFLDLISSEINLLPPSRQIKIIDLGCGKAYLTFALYHYLSKMLSLDVVVIGIDLKKEVIESLNQISSECGYAGLKFEYGSIYDFKADPPFDMAIALHACDIATDSALAKAVELQAKVILAAPCCQNELYSQIECSLLTPLLKYGILKERFSALATDACRAILLNLLNYKTQVLEFIDSKHTPKNILLKAVKSDSLPDRKELLKNYRDFKTFLGVKPSLEKFLDVGDL